MKKFPEWVPEEVIEYYRRQCVPQNTTLEYHQLGTEVLCRAMESENMRKAWQAIANRSHKVRPWYFANIIMDAVRTSEQLSSYPPPEQIATFRKLTSKVQALSTEFEDALGHWADEVMLHYFGVRPDKAIHDLADNMERFTQMVEDDRKILTDRTGKPGSKNAKRTFIIRFLSGQIDEWYGAPLHATVAATVSVIIDDNVDEEHVRKIVAYSMTP